MKTGNKVKLGIFVTISLALFIAGIYFIGERQQLFNSTFHISGIFKDVSGLQEGNNIRFSGVNVGIIGNIQQITDSTVRVDMMINERAHKFIKKNAKVVIGSDGLLGNKIAIILPGTPGREAISNNDTIATTQPISIDDILVKVKVTSDNTADITENLAYILQNIRQGKGMIGKLFSDSAFAQNVDQTVVNLKQGAGGFKKNMDAASHNFLLKGFFKRKKHKDDDDK